MTNSEYMAAAVDIALAAGTMIADRMGGNFAIDTKSEKHDYVTEVDLASEKLVRERINVLFPDHHFFGEEEASGDLARAREKLAGFGPEDFVWFVDPIDGTTNFVRRLPLFCVSIALAKGGRIIAAAVMDPSRSEIFSAARGVGAFVNGQPMRVSGVGDLGDAIVSTSLPTAVHTGRQESLSHMRHIFPMVSTARIVNCAALSLVNVASGRTDAHWEYGLNIWDMAAGALIISEAGGRVTTMDGSEFSIFSRDIICGNDQLHRILSREIAASRG